MVNTLFPVYPDGIRMINQKIGTKTINEGKEIVYFNSGGPIYQHFTSDYQSFRYITSQLMALKEVRQIEIIRFFKISTESAKRWLKVYRGKGAPGFFAPQNRRKKGAILTQEVIQKIESQLREGKSVSVIGTELGIKNDTISKAIRDGRIVRPAKKPADTAATPDETDTQWERSRKDGHSPMGMGCTNVEGRLDAIKKK